MKAVCTTLPPRPGFKDKTKENPACQAVKKWLVLYYNLLAARKKAQMQLENSISSLQVHSWYG